MAAPVGSPAELEAEAKRLLDAIAQARKRIEDLPGLLDGALDRFRDRIDRLIRESEVDNRRQVRIFLRDVDAIAAELAKAAKEHRLSPKHLAILDLSLRKAKQRDFYGARKAWRKLDKVAEQAAEVRRLQAEYRDLYRGVETHVRGLKAEAQRLERVPRPPAAPEEAARFVELVDRFNATASAAYMDFLSTARAATVIPLLLGASQGAGIGIPAAPRGADPEPLVHLLADPDPAKEDLRSRSFFGLLELPKYSDAKLTHAFGDARAIRSVLDAAWPWLKAVREDERRSLVLSWTEDISVLRRRLPALLAFLGRIAPASEAKALGDELLGALERGDLERWQAAARLYGAHQEDAERKWRGELEGAVDAMRKEEAAFAKSLRSLPDPSRTETGNAR